MVPIFGANLGCILAECFKLEAIAFAYHSFTVMVHLAVLQFYIVMEPFQLILVLLGVNSKKFCMRENTDFSMCTIHENELVLVLTTFS